MSDEKCAREGVTACRRAPLALPLLSPCLLALRVRGHLLVTSPPGALAFEIKDENSTFGKNAKRFKTGRHNF